MFLLKIVLFWIIFSITQVYPVDRRERKRCQTVDENLNYSFKHRLKDRCGITHDRPRPQISGEKSSKYRITDVSPKIQFR